jgi:hypothetical protein
MRQPLLPVVVLLFLAGCGVFAGKQSRALRASPDYKAGYSDGCASAGGQDANMRDEGQVKDDALFRTSKAYRAGWSGGLGACRRGRTTPASPSQNGPIPDIMPGGGALP